MLVVGASWHMKMSGLVGEDFADDRRFKDGGAAAIGAMVAEIRGVEVGVDVRGVV